MFTIAGAGMKLMEVAFYGATNLASRVPRHPSGHWFPNSVLPTDGTHRFLVNTFDSAISPSQSANLVIPRMCGRAGAAQGGGLGTLALQSVSRSYQFALTHSHPSKDLPLDHLFDPLPRSAHAHLPRCLHSKPSMSALLLRTFGQVCEGWRCNVAWHSSSAGNIQSVRLLSAALTLP
jgi:hypothetical protein